MIDLYQIQAKHFTAGFCIDATGLVWKTAPIIRWMEEKPLSFIKDYCTHKGWTLIEVSSEAATA